MTKIKKQYLKALHEAQEQVHDLIRPYHARCIGEYVETNGRSAIETFTLYSREEDAGDGRHHIRGIFTVWYGFPIAKGERCSVNFSFDEAPLWKLTGLKSDHTYAGTARLMEKIFPPLKKEE